MAVNSRSMDYAEGPLPLEQNPWFRDTAMDYAEGPLPLEQNPWFQDTTRLEKAGFRQVGRVEEGRGTETLYEQLRVLVETETPFETVGIYPFEQQAFAIYALAVSEATV